MEEQIMLLLTPHIKILLAIETMDFRKGIPGIMGICKKHLQEDPFSGILFVFRNRKQNAIKALIYDGQGFWLHLKKFSSGRLKWWPQNKTQTQQVTANELQIILAKGEPNKANLGSDWLPIIPK
jgi:transposase